MRIFNKKTCTTSITQLSLEEAEKKLAVIDLKLAMQSTVVPSGASEDERLAQEQADLLDYKDFLLEAVINLPVCAKNNPESFITLWKRIRSPEDNYQLADLLVVKVEEHFARG